MPVDLVTSTGRPLTGEAVTGILDRIAYRIDGIGSFTIEPYTQGDLGHFPVTRNVHIWFGLLDKPGHVHEPRHLPDRPVIDGTELCGHGTWQPDYEPGARFQRNVRSTPSQSGPSDPLAPEAVRATARDIVEPLVHDWLRRLGRTEPPTTRRPLPRR
jgi:hypothetical protein